MLYLYDFFAIDVASRRNGAEMWGGRLVLGVACP